jgi:hypothetical protein
MAFSNILGRGGHFNRNHVHFALVTLIIIKFPVVSEAPK